MCEMRTFIGEIQFEAEFEHEKLIFVLFAYFSQPNHRYKNQWHTKLE